MAAPKCATAGAAPAWCYGVLAGTPVSRRTQTHGRAVRNAATQEKFRRLMPEGSQLSREQSSALLTIPNMITFARLCAVPLAVWLVLQHRMAEVFYLFVLAGLSDAVDGWLARRRGTSAL